MGSVKKYAGKILKNAAETSPVGTGRVFLSLTIPRKIRFIPGVHLYQSMLEGQIDIFYDNIR